MSEQLQPYPLEEICKVKEERKNKAVRVVHEKQMVVTQEEEKLQTLEAEYMQAIEYKKSRINELMRLLNEGEITPKYFEQMMRYTIILDEKIAEAYKAVNEQQKNVDKARKELDEAKVQLKLREIEVDKIKEHKKEWCAEESKRVDEIVEDEIDEIGALMVESKKIQNRLTFGEEK